MTRVSTSGRVFILATALALQAGCSGAPGEQGEHGEQVGHSSSAIARGAPDSADPAVVRIADANCSGTLVAPRAVLTAAHCGVTPGSAVTFSDGTSIPTLAFHAHPEWDPITARNDIALVVLAAASAVSPVPLSTAPVTDAQLGERLRIVGYGETGDGGAAGTKHTGFTTIVAYDGTTMSDSAQPAASCAGDSGGPALIMVAGVESIAGVTSRGDAACASFGVKTRVDAYVTHFLAPAITATAPGALAVGKACDADSECASGRCIAAVDSDSVHYCSDSCSVDRDCPDSMRCAGGSCVYEAPSPGAPGSPCEANGDCAGNLCVARTYGGARTCAVLCEAAAASPCSPGFTCAPTEDRDASACFPVEGVAATPASGGCAVTRRQQSHSGSAIAGVVALLFGLQWSSRRRRNCG